MNYQEMSDRDIDFAVFQTIFGKDVFTKDADLRRAWKRGISYCNSWADAGPIIQENRITIINENLSIPVAVNDCYGWYCDEDKPLHCRNENPLRAAMILFLMMKGGE